MKRDHIASLEAMRFERDKAVATVVIIAIAGAIVAGCAALVHAADTEPISGKPIGSP